MNCVVDIGNTRTKIAWFDQDELIAVEIGNSEKEIQNILASRKIEKSIISSVADEGLTNFVISILEEPVILNSETTIPITNKYESPESLGRDRLANAVAANLLFNENNILIIDAGTCLKFDFINKSNEYIGGSISPGLTMRFKALHTFTDKLPLISPEQIEPVETGRNTAASIHSGCYTGMNNEIMATIRKYKDSYEDLRIIITGGDMEELQKMEFSQKNSIFADRWLTLRGLNQILRHNA